jgi:hypothetical protein
MKSHFLKLSWFNNFQWNICTTKVETGAMPFCQLAILSNDTKWFTVRSKKTGWQLALLGEGMGAMLSVVSGRCYKTFYGRVLCFS